MTCDFGIDIFHAGLSWHYLDQSRVIYRSEKKNVAKVVSATSSEGFLIGFS